MGFEGLYAQYQRLCHDHAAWKLLRADNAPIILAFLSDLFSQENEIPFGRARTALETELQRCRELGLWESQQSAGSYLNQWIRAGWLREMNDCLTKTDHCDVAIRFCQGLNQRTTNTSASHLRIVQEAVSQLAIAINPNIKARIQLLKQKKRAIEKEMHNLQQGIVTELSELEKRERLNEIYQLASTLTGDFRRVEDEVRQLEQAIRIQIIEEGGGRGEILSSLMEQEVLLASTEAGSAFEGFFDLLCDKHRSVEFDDQLRTILSQPIAEQLPKQHQRFLLHLMRELSRESERVFHVRRRTEESLRSYIESDAAIEHHTVNELLHELESVAIALTSHKIDLRQKTNLILSTGSAKVTGIESLQLQSPENRLAITDFTTHDNNRELSPEMLMYLEAIDVQMIAQDLKTVVTEHGAMSMGKFIQHRPIESGLEELVAYLRIAKSINAVLLEQQETITLTDQHDHYFKANIPTYWITPELCQHSPSVLEKI